MELVTKIKNVQLFPRALIPSNIITIENHDYKSGETLRYSAGTSAIGGLTDGTDYYVTMVDDNQFKLSSIGSTTDKTFFYRTSNMLN